MEENCYANFRTQPLSKRIRDCREKRNWTQEKLAEMAEIDVKTVSRAETGKTAPRASILASLEKALNVPVVFLGSDNAKKIQIMQSFNRKILAMNLSEDEIIRLYSEKLSIAEKQITL